MAVTPIPPANESGGTSTADVSAAPAHADGERAVTFLIDADRSSVDRYLASADRMAVRADVVWKACAVLIVLIMAAWFMGLLPGAVRLI